MLRLVLCGQKISHFFVVNKKNAYKSYGDYRKAQRKLVSNIQSDIQMCGKRLAVFELAYSMYLYNNFLICLFRLF